MKKKLFRIIILTLTLALLISALASCEKTDEDANFVGVEAFTFLPSEPSDRGVEEFKEIFRNSDYYADFIEYGECYNFIPEDVSAAYGIDAFSYVARDTTKYYVLYDGEVFRADRIGGNANADHGFVQFALADYNGDGFFELLCSYNASREDDENDRWGYCHSHIFILDSRTHKSVQSYTNYDGIIYFKKGEDGLFDAWQSPDKNPENANVLYRDLQKNTVKYKFSRDKATLSSSSYMAVVTVDEGTAHFPITFEDLSLTFEVNVKMTYLGETFTYTNGTGYLAGAVPSFVCGEEKVPMEGWFETTIMSKFTVTTGQVIEREYSFYNSALQPNKEGKYDLVVEYRGEKAVIKNFLEITTE